MELSDFWSLIERSGQGHDGSDEHMDALRGLLAALPPEEILSFGHWLYRLHSESYQAKLWGAAYLINGGCSDDGFDYFRAWLIAQGKEVYEAALANPDSLVSVAEEDATELEDLLGVPAEAYESATGAADFYSRLPAAPRRDISDDEFAVWSDGEGDIDERKARELYPRLFEKFWE